MRNQHRLSNIDQDALTGDCAACGRGASLVTEGRRLRCKSARQDKRRQYRKGHRTASKVSPHALKGGTNCPKCGPVTPVPWGRGKMCPNRAKELGWTPPEIPSPRCHRCERFLTAEGVCLTCTPVTLPASMADGFHVGEMPLGRRVENAVSGWKTIGPALAPDDPWNAYLANPDMDLDNAFL